jgi:basic membrane protein A and related proteins
VRRGRIRHTCPVSGDLPPAPESQPGPNRRVGEPGGPPAGINTFLIADIRGYTVFTQERGDEAAAELARAFAGIARAGVEARGGSVVELRGDEALAVFPSARQAMRAAVELQAAFTAHTQAHPELPMRVGIGLDAGEAVQVESGYRGGALNLAARLCSTAAAGEVLASQQVVHLARRIEGLRFESRGRIPLKGLAEPVEVVRVTAGDDLTPPAAPPRHARQRRALAMAVVGLAVLAAAIAVFFVTRPTGAAASASGCELAAGSLTDHAFNQAIFDGLTRAVADYGTTIGGARSTQTPAAGLAVLHSFLKHRCDLIASTSIAQDIVNPAARRHPSQKFLLLDPPETPALPNVLGVTFDVEQSAFLAGYVAAGVSKTGRVATFGAVPISTVTPYMDGFAAGVARYDRDQGAHVRVLGWDARTQRGTFIAQAGFGAFGDRARARRIGENLISQGADILFPVAGGAGLGAAAAARAHPGVLVVGVDFDQFFQAPQYADLWLTSVRKRYDVAVADVMQLVENGRFRGGRLFTATLANGGVDIAPFHDLAGRVPARVKERLPALEKGIAGGSIRTGPPGG